MITDAQRRLIAHLVRILREETETRVRRWGGAAEIAARYASKSQLLLARDWNSDLVLTLAGDVVVVDTETGLPPVAATEKEARAALFRSIEVFPELLSLLPVRPADAVTCESCEGTGVPEIALQSLERRNLVCYCSGAGWLVPSTGV